MASSGPSTCSSGLGLLDDNHSVIATTKLSTGIVLTFLARNSLLILQLRSATKI